MGGLNSALNAHRGLPTEVSATTRPSSCQAPPDVGRNCMTTVGGKRRLFVPYQMAYGEKGRGQIPPKAELIFDVELLGLR